MPSLRALVAAGVAPDLVVVPPDRPRRRGGHREPCPVAAAAEVLGLDVHATADVNAAPSVAALHARQPQLLVVVAFGQILGEEVLSLPSVGAVNLHFSLLPRWRGAAPVQRALEAGDAETGVTVQRVVRALDAGPVVATRRTAVESGERAGELEERLADMGAALLGDVVSHVAETGGLIAGRPQEEAAVTRARKVTSADGGADFALSAVDLERRARAFHPWPLLHCQIPAVARSPVTILFHRVRAEEHAGGAAPGSVLETGPAGILVACGEGALRITELQRAGGKVLDAAAFLNGVRLNRGDVLE